MSFLYFLGHHYSAFVAYVVVGVFVILVSTYVIREVCYRRYGIDVCPGAAGNLHGARQRRQVMQDARVALEVQEEIEQENRRNACAQRRKERRAKYELFLKPYTMVIRKEDFYQSCTPKLQPVGERDIETGSVRSMEEAAAPSSSSDVVESPIKVPCLSTTNDHILLTLPVTTAGGKPRRVEASCSICLMEYEEGEAVIWSTRKKCPHAFHDECILTWLGTGKKRCPCCRNFFVPGAAVDDKEVIVDNGSDEMINEESEENNDEATEEAIIEGIRSTAHAVIDAETGSPRRRSAHDSRTQRLAPQLPPEAENITPANTI